MSIIERVVFFNQNDKKDSDRTQQPLPLSEAVALSFMIQ